MASKRDEWLYMLFSLSGRIGGREYLNYRGTVIGGSVVGCIGGLIIGIGFNWWTLAGFIIMSAMVVGNWAYLALRVKRAHDL